MDISSVTARKRPRAPAAGFPSESPAGGAPAAEATAHLSFASSHGPLNVSALSTSTAAGRVCTIPSHARLDQVNKQLELLRRLDGDAHEVVVQELQEQVEQLRSQVEALSRSLEAAERSARAAIPPAPAVQPTAGLSSAQSQRASAEQLAAALEDAAAARRLLALEKESAAARDAAATRAAAQYAAAIADLQVGGRAS